LLYFSDTTNLVRFKTCVSRGLDIHSAIIEQNDMAWIGRQPELFDDVLITPAIGFPEPGFVGEEAPVKPTVDIELCAKASHVEWIGVAETGNDGLVPYLLDQRQRS
jgi:hypothetical protein